MAKEIKVEWCENWIKARFEKHPFSDGGFEINHFFDMAEKAGLYVKGTYGSPFSQALANLCEADVVKDNNGNFCYHSFRLKKPTVWCVDYAGAAGCSVHSRLFMTEKEAREFYKAISDCAYREVYKTEDIWGWTKRQKKGETA